MTAFCIIQRANRIVKLRWCVWFAHEIQDVDASEGTSSCAAISSASTPPMLWPPRKYLLLTLHALSSLSAFHVSRADFPKQTHCNLNRGKHPRNIVHCSQVDKIGSARRGPRKRQRLLGKPAGKKDGARTALPAAPCGAVRPPRPPRS